MKRTAVLMSILLAGALAFLLGKRLSADAVALVIGVGCGVFSSIPSSLLIVWATTRQSSAVEPVSQFPRAAAPYPPVVVINPGYAGQPGYGAPMLPGYGMAPLSAGYEQMAPPSTANSRVFRVMGTPDTEDDAPAWRD